MGCDIHIVAEVKKGEQWETVGSVFKDSYDETRELTIEPYNGRNYELFAFLAGVRNRFEIAPISEPKGFPNDITSGAEEHLDSGDHSASWLTVQELLDADWGQKIRLGGVVPSDVYEYLKSIDEVPKSYSQGISGNNIVQVQEDEWKKLSWQEKINGSRYYVYMYWEATVADQCKWFIENTIPALKALGKPDEVRVVFNFDN